MNFVDFTHTSESANHADSVKTSAMPGRRSNPLKTPPNRIQEVRLSKEMTLEAIGKKLGTNWQRIQRYETGATPITLEWLCRIARVLGLPTHQLVSGSDPAADVEERALVNIFRRIPADRRGEVLRMLDVLAKPEESQRRRA